MQCYTVIISEAKRERGSLGAQPGHSWVEMGSVYNMHCGQCRTFLLPDSRIVHL